MGSKEKWKTFAESPKDFSGWVPLGSWVVVTGLGKGASLRNQCVLSSPALSQILASNPQQA